MCWIPEQRDGLGEDKTILDIPVDLFRQRFLNAKWAAEEAFQGSAGLSHVDVGDLVESHEYRCEQGVHQHADAQRNPDFAPVEIGFETLCGSSVKMETAVQQGQGATFEDGHGRCNHHTQNSPNQHLGQQAEAFFNVNAFTDAQGEHLTKGAEDGKLEETHQQSVFGGGGIKPVPSAWDESEAANDGSNNQYGDEIGFFHDSSWSCLLRLSCSLFCQYLPNRQSTHTPKMMPPSTKPVWEAIS